MRLRANVYIKGSTIQRLYGTNEASLALRAIKRLTVFPAGTGSLWPDRIEIQKQVRVLDGNSSLWETITTIRYDELTSDQYEWRKHAHRS